MERENTCGNVYRTCRQVAGVTQERWAEMLGISVDSIRLYESGRGLPSDDVVDRMVVNSGHTILGWQHLRNKSSLANDILPDVEELPLSVAVIRLLGAMRSIRGSIDAMLLIAQDDMVSKQESEEFAEIVEELDAVVEAALCVKHAKGVHHA